MIEIGDRGVVAPSGGGEYLFYKGYLPLVGDSVLAYPIKNKQYAVLPLEALVEVGDEIAVIPDEETGEYTVAPIGTTGLQPGYYYLTRIVSYAIGPNGSAAKVNNVLGFELGTWTEMGGNGWFKGAFAVPLSKCAEMTVWEKTDSLFATNFNQTDIQNHTYPNPGYTWDIFGSGTKEVYYIQFYAPNMIYISVNADRSSGWGNICAVQLEIR
jgi:hypothetical protein